MLQEPTMSSSRTRVSGTVATLFVALGGSHVAWSQLPSRTSQPGTKERTRIVLSHVLPTLDGDHLKATVVEVNYGPGESSLPHSHPCAVIGYVIQGTYRSQVKGEPEAIYKAGESFYEAPNGVHQVSANASAKDPLKFLAFFTCD